MHLYTCLVALKSQVGTSREEVEEEGPNSRLQSKLE